MHPLLQPLGNDSGPVTWEAIEAMYNDKRKETASMYRATYVAVNLARYRVEQGFIFQVQHNEKGKKRQYRYTALSSRETPILEHLACY